MSKEKKGNRESKKPKAKPDDTKKEKKDSKRYDEPVTRLFKSSHNEQ